MSLENPYIYITKQLKPLEDAVPQRRIHPPRAAKKYLSGEIPPATSCPYNTEFAINIPHPLTDEELENKLGLDTIVIDWMVQGANRMRPLRPPYGLVYSEGGFNGDFSGRIKVLKDPNLLGNPFSTFSSVMRYTLAHSLKTKLDQILTNPEGREAIAYKSYLEFVNRNNAIHDDSNGINYTASLANTGLRTMGDIISHIADIDSSALASKPDIDELAIAARNSSPLIVKLSSFEENVFTIILKNVSAGGVWRSLQVVEHSGNMYFQIKDPIIQHAIDQLSQPDTKAKLEAMRRGGCPARMRFNGKSSAIETLWNWYIDYAQQVSRPTPTISR